MKSIQKAMGKLEHLLEWGGTKKEIILLVLSAIALICSLCGVRVWGVDPAWVSILFCGVPIVLEAIIGLVTAFDIKADVLVSLALIASVCIGEDFAAGEVALIMQLGGLLEDLTVAKARAGIEKLVHLTPRTGRVLTKTGEKVVPAQEIQVGDRLRVLPGETVPVDGVVLSGRTSINQAVMTGESMPVDKVPGDPVSSGTVNQYGAFEMEARRVGADSSIQRMIRLVQSADAGKAKIVGLADRWATWIVVIALTAAGITWAVSGQIIRAVTILVVFCPCSMVLATPTAIMAAIGNVTKHGFLVRQGDALERLAKVDTITFDKTGTLTYGTPTVVHTATVGDYTAEVLFAYTAGAECYSEHPLGKAVVQSYKTRYGKDLPAAEDFQMLPGCGVSAVVDGHRVLAGNDRMLAQEGLALSQSAAQGARERREQGETVVFVAIDGVLQGWLSLADLPRQESAAMLQQLMRLGVTPVLLTGDHQGAAQAVAGQLGLSQVQAGCLPEDKLNFIANARNQGHSVCMIGDGINDAPALKSADVGIAMGGIGSDIAVDAADIVLVDDEVKELPHLVALSHRMMVTIKCNLSFSMLLNFVAIVLAITGVLGPVVGALVHNAGSVLVIINSAILLNWRKKK